MSKILQLSRQGNVANVEKYLKGLQPDALSLEFRQTVLSGKSGDAASFLQAVFQGSPVESDKGDSCRVLLCKSALKVLGGQEVSSKMASEIIGYLLIEIGNFPVSCLVEIADMFMDAVKSKDIRNGRAFELLPKVISTLAAMETVTKDSNRMSGQEFKDHLLNNFCSCRWESQCAIHLASVFREIPLSSDQLQFVINKLLRVLKHVDLQELPPLVYQLLLLSSKGHKKIVLEGLTGFFAEQDRRLQERQGKENGEELVSSSFSKELLRHTEGTIIIHITFSIKQDQELGREFIKFLKNGQQRDCSTVLAPFNVALALSVAQIHRFEEQIFDFLKSTILKSLKDAKRQKDSPWIADIVPAGSNVLKLLLKTVENSMYGWDHVIHGLVMLGFTLMDSFGPKPGPFGGKAVEGGPGTPSTPNQQASQLGRDILLNLFKSQDGIRSSILEQILNRVVTRTAGSVSQYIKLLSSMVTSAPQTVLDCMGKVREAFDYLTYLPASTAEGLLKAFQPLMRLNVTLKDSLMLVLRKAMFSRQGEARKIAVLGYLQILKHFRVFGSLPMSQASQGYIMGSTSSQIQVDIHGGSNQASNYEAIVCMEILGNLRRCLTQQADIRLVLYEGLFEVLCRNTKLQGAITDMLQRQFKAFYEADEDVQPPLKLQPCITAQGTNVFLAEPLAHLLQSLVQCLTRCKKLASSKRRGGEDWDEEPFDEDDDVDKEEVLEKLESMMESLTDRMVACELEDFHVDKSADFSTTSGVGVRNNLFAILLLGIHEVLMEYVCTTSKASQFKIDDMNKLLPLYKKYHQIADILREKSSKGKGGGGTKSPKSLLSMGGLANICAALYSDEMPSHQEGLDLLRENTDFCRYVVSTAVQKLEQMKEKGQCDGPQGTHPDKLYQHCCTIARVFFQKFSSGLVTAEDRSKKNKSVMPLCLQGLSTALSVVTTFYPDKLVDFLHCVDPLMDGDGGDEPVCVDEQDVQERVHLHMKKYQRMVIDVLTGGEDSSSTTKDAIHLCHIMEMLIKRLNPQGTQFTQVQSWISKVSTENTIEDTGLCRVVMTMLFTLTSKMTCPVSLLRDVAEDIHSQVGDIDPEVEVEDRTHNAAVNSKTATPTVLLLWMQQADHVLDDTEWLVVRLRAESQAAQIDVIDAAQPLATQREDTEKAICNQLGMLVTGFHELVQTSLPAGPCIDALLKSLNRVYGVLTLLCKFYLAMYTQKSGQMSGRFEKLVKLTGTHLTHPVYGLITYVQQTQTEKLSNLLTGGKASKGKDKKKGDKGLVAAAVTAGKARVVMRETRPIPNLIFAIDRYREPSLISTPSKKNLGELAC
eukprot:XP_011677214.1 PREDICTED: Fanconi anemia group I protein [Strongylocentrotus purpuratus]